MTNRSYLFMKYSPEGKVTILIKHMHSSFEVHLEAIYKILRYLKNTSGKGLYFKKNEQRELKYTQMQTRLAQ